MGKIQQQRDFLVDATVGLLRSEGLFQVTHHMSRRYKTKSGRNTWFSRACSTDRKSSSGSIVDFVTLNKIAFECLATLLPWVQTWIGVINTKPLTPDGWFEEGHGKREKRTMTMEYGCPIIQRDFYYWRQPFQWKNWC